ncbi:MAG: DHHW family protein [Eubacteriales bacterium]|nr:DHHW family protein [Eubacteriales bacterium]
MALPVVMLISILLPDRSFSEKENRILASRPKIGISQMLSGQYEKNYETYVNDQFPLRDFWVALKAGTDRLTGKVEENGVYLGKDGYLMEAFQAPPQEQLSATVNAMTAFAKRHSDLNQYALIAPNAVSILKDRLPAFAPAQDQNPYIDALKSSLEEVGVTFIDVRDTLNEHKEEGIYYHTDHHWTTQGAYYAYLQAADTMNLNGEEISYEKVPVSYSFQGTLSARSGFRSGTKEELDVFLPQGDSPSSVVNYVQQQKKTGSFYATEKLSERDKYGLFFNGNHPQIKISTPVEDNRTLLVLKDSYANSLVPFLAPHYRTIIMVDPRYYYGNLEELIQVENVQDVLYLYNANTFFSDTSLEMCLAPQENQQDEQQGGQQDE